MYGGGLHSLMTSSYSHQTRRHKSNLFDKSSLACRRIRYFSRQIYFWDMWVIMAVQKVYAVTSWPKPTTVKDLQKFLGLIRTNTSSSRCSRCICGSSFISTFQPPKLHPMAYYSQKLYKQLWGQGPRFIGHEIVFRGMTMLVRGSRLSIHCTDHKIACFNFTIRYRPESQNRWIIPFAF